MGACESQDNDPTRNEDRGENRREFLEKGIVASVGAAMVSAAAGSKEAQARGSKELPREAWAERMKAPDDGKRYGWIVDTRRCFGCHGCEVACKAENDIPLGNYMRQTIYHDYERPSGGFARVMVPMACQHCEDAPCLKACPCGALHKGPGGSVQINYDSCSGHAACKDACPYGAIYIDPVANQAVKCHNCTHRIAVGMEPACVTTCPSEALYFGDLNDPASPVSRMKKQLEREEEGSLEVLRPEKGTKPRMEFVVDPERPLEEWEPKIPKEGESYSPEAYSVFNWRREETGEGRR